MDRPKAKDTSLNEVLAQFDIETQVNKMVMRSFDTLMKNNKQAFEFIKEGEHRFIEFESRLHKAEHYYKNLEENFTTKFSIINGVNEKLDEFSTHFWATVKEVSSDTVNITKDVDRISKEKFRLENRVDSFEGQVRKIQSNAENIQAQLNAEVQKIMSRIQDEETTTEQKIKARQIQVLELRKSLAECQSLLSSKASLISELLQDFKLYKHERPQIHKQIETIFQNQSTRAFKQDVTDLRGYIDSKIMSEKQRVDNIMLRVDTRIKVEERDRKSQDSELKGKIESVSAQCLQLIEDLKKESSEKNSEINVFVEQIESEMKSSDQRLENLIDGLKNCYDKEVPQIKGKIAKNYEQFLKLTKDVGLNVSQTQEASSNIQSINTLIDRLTADVQRVRDEATKEIQKREAEMNQLKSSASGQGDIAQQVLKLTQRCEQLTVGNEKLQQSNRKLEQQIETLVEDSRKMSKNQADKQGSLERQLKSEVMKLEKIIEKQRLDMALEIKSLREFTAQQIKNLDESLRSIVSDKMDQIKEDLQNLEAISKQFEVFKAEFQKQIEENNKVQQSIAEKVERMMSSIKKMKSDFSISVEKVSEDLQKRNNEIKQIEKQFKKVQSYLGLSNECLTFLLALEVITNSNPLSKTGNDTKGSSRGFTSNARNRINNSSTIIPIESTVKMAEESQQLNSGSSVNVNVNANNFTAKLSSILEGWILEIDEKEDKYRFRGQNMMMDSNSKKLSKMYLEYLIKKSEQLKGSMLQNGKDIFLRILESSEDIFQQRKRIASRRKPSDLPKLYF